MVVQPEPTYAEDLSEARRGSDVLASEVTVIRGRVVSILGMGGLAASYVGALTIREGASVGPWAWTALGAFVAMAVLSVVVLLPHRFHVSQDPATLVGWAEDDGASEAEIQCVLALWLGRKYDENRPKVGGGTRTRGW